MRTVYKFANTAAIPVVSTNLQRALFINLKEDALAFLAGVSLTSDSLSLRFVALRHAAAFLDAHSPIPKPVDFQTILPALLAALPALDVPGREAAMDCILIMWKLSEAKPMTVYGFDSIYGDVSGMLPDFAELFFH
jgi:U3 small nucleolar RNA-associated protein 10